MTREDTKKDVFEEKRKKMYELEEIAKKLYQEAEEILKKFPIEESESTMVRYSERERRTTLDNKWLYEWARHYAIIKMFNAMRYLSGENEYENRSNILLQYIAQRAIDLSLKMGNYIMAAFAAELAGYREFAIRLAMERFNEYLSRQK